MVVGASNDESRQVTSLAPLEWIAIPLGTGEDELGEGIIWSVKGACLYWVDIPARAVRRHAPGRHGVTSWLAPDMPTALGECPDGRLIVIGRKAAWLLDPVSGRFVEFCQIESNQPHNRSNDGRIGPDGRFWFGTMADNFQPKTVETLERRKTGALYSLAGNSVLTRHLHGLGVPNSIAFDPNRNRMYVGDSWEKAIHLVEMPGIAAMAGLEPFFVTTELGTNDGSSVDREGTTWNARWGAGCVAAIDPYGEVRALVRLPNARPSCCTFGGEGMNTLYITTAAPLNAEEVGGLFSVELPVPGNEPWLFDLPQSLFKEPTSHG